MTEPIVVVGDALLDIDVDTDAQRLVPDVPAPVLEERARRPRPGGAALAALLAARSTGRCVLLVAGVPEDEAGARLRDLLPANVTLVPLPCRGRTPVKTRLRAGGRLWRGWTPAASRSATARCRPRWRRRCTTRVRCSSPTTAAV